jgi:hypothetical protein
LRWSLSRDRARTRRAGRNSPRTVRRLERNPQNDNGLSRTLKRLQRELEDLKDGTSSSKKEEWKNRSNKIQFHFNNGSLKLLREVLQFHSEGGRGDASGRSYGGS